MIRKARDPKVSAQAAAIARAARSVQPGYVADRIRLWVPESMHPILDGQTPGERGKDWVTGHLVNTKLKLLWRVLGPLSGYEPSITIDSKETTIVVGPHSFTGASVVEVVLKAIAHYLPEEASGNDLEERLTELDLLE